MQIGSSNTQNLTSANTCNCTKASLGSRVASGLAKTAGVIGLGTIAYDAHKLGVIRANENRRDAIADSCLDAYLDTTQLSDSRCVMSKIQDGRFRAELKGQLLNGPREFFHSVCGYVKGIAESLACNVIPLGLSALALLTNGKVSKISAAALTAYGAADVAKNAFCIGKTHTLNVDA